MKNCIACSSEGKKSPAHHNDLVYGRSSGSSTTVRLCYTHSVELFKTGQSNFVSKYRPEAVEEELKKKDKGHSSYFGFGSFK